MPSPLRQSLVKFAYSSYMAVWNGAGAPIKDDSLLESTRFEPYGTAGTAGVFHVEHAAPKSVIGH